jgi:hypothetical protein
MHCLLVPQMGTILAGGIAAGIYTTNLPEVSTGRCLQRTHFGLSLPLADNFIKHV